MKVLKNMKYEKQQAIFILNECWSCLCNESFLKHGIGRADFGRLSVLTNLGHVYAVKVFQNMELEEKILVIFWF